MRIRKKFIRFTRDVYKRQLRMELEWAKRGCRARSTKQRARLERLEALKNGKAPVQETDVQMDSVETRMGKKTVELHHISKSYGDKVILDDFDYIVLRLSLIHILTKLTDRLRNFAGSFFHIKSLRNQLCRLLYYEKR